MDDKQLLNEAIEELLKENDGVNPNSPIPIEEQLEKKRAEYREYLELKPLKSRIEKSIEILQSEMSKMMEEDNYEVLMSELVDAGEMLTEHPEIQGKNWEFQMKPLLFSLDQIR